MRLKPSALVAVFAVLPFVVGFTPPEEEGTHVSVSAGKGRFLAISGCNHPHIVKFTDQQAGAYHVWKLQNPKAPRIGAGLDVNAYQSEVKECTEQDCANSSPGWERNPTLFSASPYMTLDWKWVGVSAGGNLPLHWLIEPDSGHDVNRAWQVLPMRGSLRVGPTDFLYGTIEVFNGQPVSSGLVFPMGIGGRLLGFDLWAGGMPAIEDGSAASGIIARRFGPVRLRLSATYAEDSDHYSRTSINTGEVIEDFEVSHPRHSFAVGFDYHLPW